MADGIIKIAIMAVGGQGGGVLSNWIVALAERNGYAVQFTSVAGVAQRTGATIYYVEMMPDTGRQPVFALAPTAGDVDILVAAELMEAGRAILRGFVTPDRTALIASAHRALAVSEKIVPGDGMAKGEEVAAAAEVAARHFLSFDMEEIARRSGSVISASLFGALAGSGELPFQRESYEETIRASGRGVEASLRAFGAAYDTAKNGPASAVPPAEAPDPPAAVVDAPRNRARDVQAWNALVARIDAFPAPLHACARPGLTKVVDYQDLAYGRDYLDRLERFVDKDRDAGGEKHGFAFSATAAKYLANALCYDDIIRVADLKTRGSRFDRVRREMAVTETAVMHLTEFMHPRAQEICGTLPAGIGAWIEARPWAFDALDKIVNKGRRVRTDTVRSFLQLYVIAGMRRWRRALLRHRVEMAHLENWIAAAEAQLGTDYALSTEILMCRRLIKGYSDTHSRGLSKYDRVLAGIALVEGRSDAADWARRLRDAALADETGTALDGAVRTIESFSRPETAVSA